MIAVPVVELELEKVFDDLVGYCPEFMENVVITGDVDALAMPFPVTADAAVSDSILEAFETAVPLVGDVVLAFRLFSLITLLNDCCADNTFPKP